MSKQVPRRVKDITGRVFERLTVLEFVRVNKRKAWWTCECSCGKKIVKASTDLIEGKMKSCGCLRRETTKRTHTQHGMAGTKIYNIWKGMRTRCNCVGSQDYHHYGGRGITVCVRWNSFANFYADMGDRPTAQHTIERIDNDKGYSPENCCWITRRKQAQNRRNSIYITYEGETKILSEWARHLNILRSTLSRRLSVYGWSVEDAFTRKVRRKEH
jgi:hypothetical protein